MARRGLRLVSHATLCLRHAMAYCARSAAISHALKNAITSPWLPRLEAWRCRHATPHAIWNLVGDTPLLTPFERVARPPWIIPKNDSVHLVGLQAYRLELPPEMDGIHPTFHVCYMRKCLAEEESVIPLSEIRVDSGNRCVEEPEAILERKTKRLRHKEVTMVKVQWKHHRGANVTWEAKEDMKHRYPRLFT
ncbi:hypothetical protein OSB04_003085 [Centaurea solstitialis]|uniref:Chromo domain-containing protein n=1 Tax=Centaurea solstitialis TaxID=347529 RepID=A0AA38TUH7_9ASTR|nr:hypothetical protein OSB04_003085 [Centaurea solstitialis]